MDAPAWCRFVLSEERSRHQKQYVVPWESWAGVDGVQWAGEGSLPDETLLGFFS